MQIEVESKANEIVSAPELLSYLDLSGCIVTGDAMFIQRELCILEESSEYPEKI